MPSSGSRAVDKRSAIPEDLAAEGETLARMVRTIAYLGPITPDIRFTGARPPARGIADARTGRGLRARLDAGQRITRAFGAGVVTRARGPLRRAPNGAAVSCGTRAPLSGGGPCTVG